LSWWKEGEREVEVRTMRAMIAHRDEPRLPAALGLKAVLNNPREEPSYYLEAILMEDTWRMSLQYIVLCTKTYETSTLLPINHHIPIIFAHYKTA
jgi:hypothetical protein